MKIYDTLRQKLYDKVGGKGSTWNTEINPKGLAGVVGTVIIMGTGLFGCETLPTNTIRMNQGIHQSTLKPYNIDEIEIDGKYYSGLSLPKNKTGKIVGKKNNELILNRDLLLNYYLIPYSNSKEIRGENEVTVEPLNEAYILANPDYCKDNHNLILPAKDKKNLTEREITLYSHSMKINQMSEIRNQKSGGNNVSRRNIKTLDEIIPTIILGKEDDRKEFLFMKQKETDNVHPNIINGSENNSPQNVGRLPAIFLDNPSEFYTTTIRENGTQTTAEKIKGNVYIPIKAEIVDIETEKKLLEAQISN